MITGLRPDEAFNLQHRDITIAATNANGSQILEIEVRGKRGVGHCKSMPGAVRVYQRLLARAKPVQGETRRQRQQRRKEGGGPPPPPVVEYPKPTDLLFPGNHIKLFNNLLDRTGLKLDRDEKPRTAYSLRHTYICMRLMEGRIFIKLPRTVALDNGKLAADLAKMAQRPETYRYVFFMSPRHPKAERLPQYERDDVQVWSVTI